MNVAFVNPFVTATIHLYKTMLKADITPGTIRVKAEPFPTYDVSGIIGLSGDAKGAIAMSYPKVVALKTISAFLGMELKVVGPELTDAIGELANIVAGNAKLGLTQYNLSISLPNVIYGRDHMMATQSGIPTLLVPFITPYGEFIMEVALKTNK
jgi:chemotaxis protein CheX